MYDLKKLEAFCKVYELCSFSRAGEALFLSQPTVSAHVQSLEKELGVRLLDRMGRNTLPTPAGTILYQYSQRAFGELNRVKDEIQRLMGEVAGVISLGASSIPAGYILPAPISAFSARYPLVRFDMIFGDSREINKAVAEGRAMLGVVGAKSDDPGLEYQVMADDEIVLVAAPDLPCLDSEREFTVKEAAAWPWIMREEGSGTRKSLADALTDSGNSPRFVHQALKVDDTAIAIRYAMAGLGVTAVSRLAVEEELAQGWLRELIIKDIKLPRRFFIVRNVRRESFPACAAFSDFLLGETVALRLE